MGLTSKLEKLKVKGPTNASSDDLVNADNFNDLANSDDIDEVDNDGQSILMGIISQLRPGCDLTKITLPTFILEKKSMLERITNFFQIPDILLEANLEKDELRRFLLVLRWYLASWHIAPKAVKKPLNPVLGEVFSCYWDDLPSNNTAYYISEQTSHHPPKSSYFYVIPELKIRVDGIVIPKSKFLGNSSAAMMEGAGHVTLGDWNNETYLMNQPNVYCRGILFGKLRYELGDHMYVKCPDSGYEADIEFKTKGFISGTYDSIEGYVKKSETGEVIYNITGKWNDVMEIRHVQTNKRDIFVDTSKVAKIKPKVKPLNEQWKYESRKLWKSTVDALSKRDHILATTEKSSVEDEQRVIAKRRLQEGVSFHPKLFCAVSSDDENKDLEYIIYKNFDLKDKPETLKSKVFEIFPILPGQSLNEKFEIPAFKKKQEGI